MSSHREAPEISKDPVADNTDLYAFVSPDQPDTVTIITNYIPLRGPGRRPELLRVRRRRPLLDLHRQRRRRQARHHLSSSSFDDEARATRTRSCTTPGPIGVARAIRTGTAGSSTRSRARIAHGTQDASASGLASPAVQHRAAVDAELPERWRRPPCTTLPSGETVFAGQRNDGFYVDLGSIFDLGDLRPFQNLHLIPTPGGAGRRRAARPQRAHDRDPGPDQAADSRRLEADRPGERQVGASASGARPAGAA